MSSEVELSKDRIIEEGHNMLIIIQMTLGEEILEEHEITEIKILEVNIEVIIEMTTLEEGRSRSREKQYLGNFRRNDRSSSSRSRSGLRTTGNKDRIRCLKHRECDHFTKGCLNLQTEKEPE